MFDALCSWLSRKTISVTDELKNMRPFSVGDGALPEHIFIYGLGRG